MDEASLPIDIHTGKLLDWLISRRHVNKDWQKGLEPIRAKINLALEDMPEHQAIVQLLSKSAINFFHCRRIMEILKETEADSKNFFGTYSSKRMKDWQEIVTLYEANSIYLAEAAQILQRFVSYEIPATKKQIAKCKSSVEECGRKEVEYGKLAKEADRIFAQECEKMRLKSGDNIRKELLTLSNELSSFFTDILAQIRNLRRCSDFYMGFRAYTCKRAIQSTEVLQMVQLIIEKGDITHYEFKFGVKPITVDPMFHLDENSENYDPTEDKIDFGGDEVNFDYSSLDFDSETAIIELTDLSQSEASVVDTAGGVASGLDSLSVLEHRETQQQLLAELYELEAFLKTRLFEIESDNAAELLLGGGGTNIADPNIKAVINQSSKDVKQMLADVRKVLAEMTDPNRRHLFKIRVSPNYVNCLVEELEQKRAQGEKYRRMAKLMTEKQSELTDEAASLQLDLNIFVEKTKQLQKQIEAEISKKYKNRPVNIMGGITAALA